MSLRCCGSSGQTDLARLILGDPDRGDSNWSLFGGIADGQRERSLTLQRVFLIVIVSVVTGAATEVGKQVIASEQFRQALLWMLPWSKAEPARKPPGPPAAPDGLRHESAPAPSLPAPPAESARGETSPTHRSIETPHSEVNPHVSSRFKCNSSEETPWEHEANSNWVISKCVGHRYFAFQCVTKEIALVTQGVSRLRMAKFFRYEHMDAHDAVLVAQQAKEYYYYPLTQRFFAVFRDAFYVLLIQDTSEGLYLGLTNVKYLSNTAFPGCLEARQPM
jgi:hypothetical protein